MYLANLTTDQLSKAREAADYLLSLPARLDAELAIKLDTFRCDTGAALEDRGVAIPSTSSGAMGTYDPHTSDLTALRTDGGGGQ